MDERFTRTKMLLGEEAVSSLERARVIVFGVGGVGSFACEALIRAGVGSIDFVDNDTVSITNINRQLVALTSTIGRYKTEVIAERAADINPNIKTKCHNVFFNRDTAESFDFSEYDYVIDAIDSVSSKLLLIERCVEAGIPIISSMGTGNKLHPEMFRVEDIYKTSGCPLARVMRRELRKRGIKKLSVVYSPEEPKSSEFLSDPESSRRGIPGTVSFVPPAAGLLLAGKVIRDIAGV